MNDKISKKDKKDWEEFIENNEKLPVKDNYFKYIKIDKELVFMYDKLNNITENIYKNCEINFSENLTFDSMISILLSKNRIKLKPFVKRDSKDHHLETFFDNNFIENINKHLILNDIIIVFEYENDKYKIGNINFPDNYSFLNININSANDKPRYFFLYYPTKCLK